jgi:hypothetical protein
MAALRSGTYLPPPTDTYDPQEDLKAHANRHKKPIKEHESYLNKEQLMELRKVQHERIEVTLCIFICLQSNRSSSVMLLIGGKDEVVGNGCEAEYGS